MAAEFELKYRLPEATRTAIIRDFPGPWEEIPMRTTYYDTPDGAISRRHWTLRHRREGSRDVCTLKTPGENHARGEWEWDCGEIRQALTPLGRLSGHSELPEVARELVEVCAAAFTRQALLIAREGFTAELVLDCGFLSGGGAQIPLEEAELELKSGSREALMAFAAAFAEKYALTAEPLSKFARARALNGER